MPEAPEANPLPKVIGTEPWLSTASVCRNSATEVLPDFSRSSRVSVWTGDAVSVLARRMFDPVTSTRCSAGAVVCAARSVATSIVAVPQNAVSRVRTTRVFLNLVVSVFICSPNQYLSRKRPEDQLAAHMVGTTSKT